MKESRSSPIIIAEEAAMAQYVAANALVGPVAGVFTEERAKKLRQIDIEFQLEMHRIHGRPQVSRLKEIDEELKLPV